MEIAVHGEPFRIDSYSLPLGSYDMVLGIQWLESLCTLILVTNMPVMDIYVTLSLLPTISSLEFSLAYMYVYIRTIKVTVGNIHNLFNEKNCYASFSHLKLMPAQMRMVDKKLWYNYYFLFIFLCTTLAQSPSRVSVLTFPLVAALKGMAHSINLL
jgi:hypothetical protein